MDVSQEREKAMGFAKALPVVGEALAHLIGTSYDAIDRLRDPAGAARVDRMRYQNPLDMAGTYPLPRAQLDRFLFKIKMTDLARASQLEVLAKKAARVKPPEFGVTFTLERSASVCVPDTSWPKRL